MKYTTKVNIQSEIILSKLLVQKPYTMVYFLICDESYIKLSKVCLTKYACEYSDVKSNPFL